MDRVLIVDDENCMRTTLCEFLKRENFVADSASDAFIACDMIKNGNYDVVVSDITMPGLSGIELLSRIRKNSQTIQVIIMTGELSVDTAVKALQNGAIDFLVKPINKESFIKAVKHAAQVKKLSDEKTIMEEQTECYQKKLEQIVEKRTNALQNIVQGAISLLSTIVEVRDSYAARNQIKVGNLSAAIAEKLALKKDTIDLIRIIGYIYDIGKIVIPIEILLKPGKLSSLEMQIIKNHSTFGYEMLMNAGLPALIGETIYQHHERLDGSGYPRGLSGDAITIEAQIIMVADVVEAMMSRRPYRPALGLDAALQEIQVNANVLYNKEIVSACTDLFLNDHYILDDSEQKIRLYA